MIQYYYYMMAQQHKLAGCKRGTSCPARRIQVALSLGKPMEEGPGPSRPSHYSCSLCCKPIPEKRHRKVLSEDGAGKASLQQMQQFSAMELLGNDVDQAVKNLMPSQRYICNHCESELNQWEKLNDQMTRLKQQIITKLDTLCNTRQSTAGQSRPPAVLPKSLAPKRLKLDPGTSPEVVVSILCYCTLYILYST